MLRLKLSFNHLKGLCRDIESHSKAWGNIPPGKKIFEFFFFNWHPLVNFIFLSDGAPPNVLGPRVTYPPYLSFSTVAWLS